VLGGSWSIEFPTIVAPLGVRLDPAVQSEHSSYERDQANRKECEKKDDV
jgi:hypothetical protein